MYQETYGNDTGVSGGYRQNPQPALPGSVNRASGLLNRPMPANADEWGQWVQQNSILSTYRDATDIRITKARMVPELTGKRRKLYAPMARFYASFDSGDSSMRADQQAFSIESIYSAGGSRWQRSTRSITSLMSASYDRVFSNGKGDYVLTNDVSFDPGADWSSISRAR
ncbi:MAG: hypothetical protein OEV63_06145 [Gammaproteobacteria bacterium]|nr:hypothetical protein [Gammaproteobacteria bacterium]